MSGRATHISVLPEQAACGTALTAQEIAQRESSDFAMTYRVPRAAVALGVLDYDARSRRFSGTPLLRLLHRDAPVSLKHYAQASPGPVFWAPALDAADRRTRAQPRNRDVGLPASVPINAVTRSCGVAQYQSRREDKGRAFPPRDQFDEHSGHFLPQGLNRLVNRSQSRIGSFGYP